MFKKLALPLGGVAGLTALLLGFEFLYLAKGTGDPFWAVMPLYLGGIFCLEFLLFALSLRFLPIPNLSGKGPGGWAALGAAVFAAGTPLLWILIFRESLGAGNLTFLALAGSVSGAVACAALRALGGGPARPD